LTITTGVGKSGAVASLFSDFLVSMGVRSRFLSPVNALHGDIGILTNEDIFIMLSKSGETDELKELVPFVRGRGAFLISIASNQDSFLGRTADMSMHIPLARELCPFNMAPTTSSFLHLLFCNTVSVLAMKKSGISLETYAKNHPGGTIGKRLTLRVQDVMITPESTPNFPVIAQDVLLKDAFHAMSFCGCVIILKEDGTIWGIFTDGDLRRLLSSSSDVGKVLDSPVSSFCNRKPSATAYHEMACLVLKVMQANKFHQMIVVDPATDKVVGLVLLRELVKLGL